MNVSCMDALNPERLYCQLPLFIYVCICYIFYFCLAYDFYMCSIYLISPHMLLCLIVMGEKASCEGEGNVMPRFTP